ncbi:MAG: putative glycosyltransferase family protein [Bradyrhizobium sp.]|jgi:spore maturation protein CgeB|nr:putative glycosyltransferase family protein [Bradyrhizobium sp.]
MNLKIVFIGLSITSSWGNGHATTYRALAKALSRRGHTVSFLERDLPWYRGHRDLQNAEYCRIELYGSLPELARRHAERVRDADLIILGSYVPDGIAIGEWLTGLASGVTAFYDIDTPVTLAGLETNQIEYISPHLIPRFDMYLSFSGGPALGIIQDLYGSPLARALYCSANMNKHLASASPKWSLGYLGTYSEDRQPALERLLVEPAQLLQDHSFVVAGSKYPHTVDWPDNVAHIAHLPPNEHPQFYGSQLYALNVTRADMKSLGFSPSVRLFEAAACGTPVISDDWLGMETVFIPGKEILIASGPRDVIKILEELPEDRRLGIAANAKARLQREHTPDHRAQQLECYYEEALVQRRPIKGAAKKSVELEEVK